MALEHGNPQLAENLRRAAELTGLGDDEVLAIYEALRPGRSTAAQLTTLAASLTARGLPRCAALLTEAARRSTKGAASPHDPPPAGPRPAGRPPARALSGVVCPPAAHRTRRSWRRPGERGRGGRYRERDD